LLKLLISFLAIINRIVRRLSVLPAKCAQRLPACNPIADFGFEGRRPIDCGRHVQDFTRDRKIRASLVRANLAALG
jgi:hypothetical protein